MRIGESSLIAGLRARRVPCLAVTGLAVLSLCAGCGREPASAKDTGAPFQPKRVEATPDVLQQQTPPERPTPQDQARDLIREYEKKIEAEPDNPDTPATLMAIGNLHRQKLMDYKEATFYYRQVITNFPDSPLVNLAYIQLADCYEQMEDWRAAQLIYREITERFPPESPEYQYAQEKQNE